MKEKKFRFTTYDGFKNEVETHFVLAANVKEAREIAKKIVGNSRDNETSHSRVILALDQSNNN